MPFRIRSITHVNIPKNLDLIHFRTPGCQNLPGSSYVACKKHNFMWIIRASYRFGYGPIRSKRPMKCQVAVTRSQLSPFVLYVTIFYRLQPKYILIKLCTTFDIGDEQHNALDVYYEFAQFTALLKNGTGSRSQTLPVGDRRGIRPDAPTSSDIIPSNPVILSLRRIYVQSTYCVFTETLRCAQGDIICLVHVLPPVVTMTSLSFDLSTLE